MANVPQIYILSGDDTPNYGFIVPVDTGHLDIATSVVSLIIETDGSITISMYVSIQEMPGKVLVFFRHVTFNYTHRELINKLFNRFDLGLMSTLGEFSDYYKSHYTSDFDVSMNQISSGLDHFLQHWYTVILECLINIRMFD
jgi:hypothetical protein